MTILVVIAPYETHSLPCPVPDRSVAPTACRIHARDARCPRFPQSTHRRPQTVRGASHHQLLPSRGFLRPPRNGTLRPARPVVLSRHPLSAHGTLLATAEHFACQAGSGFLVAELDALLGVATTDALRKLTGNHRLTRVKLGDRFLYLSPEAPAHSGRRWPDKPPLPLR